MSTDPDLSSLRGRSVVVTGCTRGFGRVLVTRLAALGARVVVSGPVPAESEELAAELVAAGGEAVVAPGDVTSEADVAALVATAVEAYGGIDIWVNNAAYETPGMARILDFPPDTWVRTTEVNVLGTGRCTLAALEHMRERGRGLIVNVTGRGDDLRPTKYSAPYGASKSWVRAFTRTLRAEYAASGVNLVAFNPGIMDTARMERAHFYNEDPDQQRTEKQMVVVKRILGDPPEVAAESLIAFLASDKAHKAKELRLITPKRVARGLADEAKHRLKR